jgi:hypothetical protein
MAAEEDADGCIVNFRGHSLIAFSSLPKYENLFSAAEADTASLAICLV